MNILYITFSDISVCSSSNIRNISLIKGLIDEGHNVDIISYQTSNEVQLKDESFTSIIKCCKVISLHGTVTSEKVSSMLLSSSSSSIKKKIYALLRKIYYSLEPVDSFRKFAKTLTIDNLNLGKYDVMISSSNPYSVHILAERIKKKYFNNIYWIQYWGDALYLDTLTRKPIFPWMLKKAEYNLMRNSDAIVYTNGVVLEMQKKLFCTLANRMSYIETPFAFSQGESIRAFEYQVGYFGSFSKSVRDIEPLYTVLSQTRYKSIIIGNGDFDLNPTEFLTVMPRTTVDVVSQYERKTRILVCVCNNLTAKEKETGLIPGKVYHYGATTQEIIVIGASPEVRKFLSKYKRYIFVENDVSSIKETLDMLLSKEPQTYTPLKEVCPSFAARKLLNNVTVNYETFTMGEDYDK